MKTNVKRYFYILLSFLLALSLGSLVILFFFKTSVIRSILDQIINIFLPFIYGFVIAYLINPVVMKIEKGFLFLENRLFHRQKKGLIRMLSILLGFVIVFLLVFMLFFAIIPQLITSISSVLVMLPKSVSSFQEWIDTLESGDYSESMIEYIKVVTDTLSGRLQSFLSTDVLTTLQQLLSNISTSFLSLFQVIKNFGIGCIVAAYLLGSKEKFQHQCRLLIYSIFSEKWCRLILDEVHYIDKMFSGFIHGKVLDSTIVGLICFLFAWITKMPYALLVALIVGVTNIIPFFGPYMGAIPSALLILMVNPAKCLLFLIFIIVLQQIDGNLLGPAILGDRLGISGFWVLFSIMIFGSLWGIVGMIVGVPLFAVIYDLIRRFIKRGLVKHGRAEMLTAYHEDCQRKT